MEIESFIELGNGNPEHDNEKAITVQQILNDSLKIDAIQENCSLRIPFSTIPSVSILTENLILTSASNVTPHLIDSLNVTCIINCAPELPDFHLREENVLYHKIEVQDRPEANISRFFDDAADLIEKVANSNGRTLIFCVAGVSRSATICLAYLMKHRHLTLLDSYNYVKSRRPRIRPNCGFFEQLIEFERRLFGISSVNMVFNELVQMEIPDVYDSEYRVVRRYDRKRKEMR